MKQGALFGMILTALFSCLFSGPVHAGSSVSSTYIRSAIGFAVSRQIEGPYEYVDTIQFRSPLLRIDSRKQSSRRGRLAPVRSHHLI